MAQIPSSEIIVSGNVVSHDILPSPVTTHDLMRDMHGGILGSPGLTPGLLPTTPLSSHEFMPSRNGYDDPHSELNRLLDRLWGMHGDRSVHDTYGYTHQDANQVIDRMRSHLYDYEKRYSIGDEEDGLVMLQRYFSDYDAPKKIRAFRRFFELLDQGDFYDKDRIFDYDRLFELLPNRGMDRLYLQNSEDLQIPKENNTTSTKESN